MKEYWGYHIHPCLVIFNYLDHMCTLSPKFWKVRDSILLLFSNYSIGTCDFQQHFTSGILDVLNSVVL